LTDSAENSPIKGYMILEIFPNNNKTQLIKVAYMLLLEQSYAALKYLFTNLLRRYT